MRIPRRAVVIVAMVFTFGVLPLIVSLPFTRYGWVNGFPCLWNAAGLVFILPGLSLLGWAIRVHDANAFEVRNIERIPIHLLTQGPYRYTRNPMYLGYLLFWLAWTVFYGSVSVLAVLVILSSIAQFILVPLEERRLDVKFGEEFRSYKKQVPRWFRLWR